ncbi:MAG: ribosome recycling factor [Myxococcales bacterium]|nr:ribosome recycling factor [Myxococcales bacterium]MCB9525037.1 ribosome recycling factor [Myxococcales bacterium]
MDEIYDDLNESFQGTFSALKRDLARVRTGRANPTLLDNIRVPYYGQPTPLNQVAAIQVPEARMITIKPWESTLLKDIERAIMASDLGLNPNNDGTLIRIAIPALTEDRRRDLVKKIHAVGEDAKIAARNHRRDARKFLEELQKASEITEDDLQRGYKKVDEMTTAATSKIDEIIKAKEEELMEV